MKSYLVASLCFLSFCLQGSELARAVQEGREDDVALLVRGATAQAKKAALNVVFDHSSYPRHARMIETILNSGGVSVDYKDNQGHTLLRRAAEHSNVDAVASLLHYGAL